jgi:hypothetical protein
MTAATENKTHLEIHVNQVRIDVIIRIGASGLPCAVARRALCVTVRVTCVSDAVFVQQRVIDGNDPPSSLRRRRGTVALSFALTFV